MKVKEIDRTANVAWSPAAQHPIYLAAGTAAQQLDATFSTTASLEIYSLNLTEPGLDMNLKGNISSDCRFHKLVWGPSGTSTSDCTNSMIVGGADGGNLFMFDPNKLINGEMALVCQRDKHTGPVTALDFNPFQMNLLASGASDSEIFIWDLNNPNSPMTPGAKSQPGEDVTCVAWNIQVQNILASTFPARCVVWDLRKNEPIIKVSDSISRIRCKCVAWHPEVATQMCLASEDDHTPVIQLWDLRFATSPLKSLENHQRGILSIAWCRQDPDLLLSCAKDNRILCWNPNSYIPGEEVVCELPTSNQWSFEVAWCPRNPAVIASSSFDGHVSISSLMGGQQQLQPSSKIADAFPCSDPYTQAPIIQTENRGVSVTLKKPPKWLRKPVGASFGFGGKLITFENVKVTSQQQQQPQNSVQPVVYVSQMVTEPSLIARSTQLETTIQACQYNDYCHLKLSTCTSKEDEKIWRFIKANFDSNPRLSFLNLLSYDPQEISSKITTFLSSHPDLRKESEGEMGVDAEELAQRMSALGSTGNSLRASPSNVTNNISTSRTPDSALNFSGDGTSAFDTIASVQSPDASPGSVVFAIPTDDDIDGLISKALLTGNVEFAVDLCLRDGRMADAVILAMAGGQDLLLKTQRKYFRTAKGEVTKLISAVVHQDWGQVARTCDVASWKEALAACLTYAKPQEFSILCETLGSRLENERDNEWLFNAMLCYICAGNVEKLAECWVKTADDANSPKALQDLVELAMVLKNAVDMQGQTTAISSGVLTDKLTEYANLLAAQGNLTTALSYLGTSNEMSILLLRNRLYKAIGQPVPGIPEPQTPFAKMDVRGVPNERPVLSSISQPHATPMQQPMKPSLNFAAQSSTVFTYPPSGLPSVPSFQAHQPSVPTFPPQQPSVPTFPAQQPSVPTFPPQQPVAPPMYPPTSGHLSGGPLSPTIPANSTGPSYQKRNSYPFNSQPVNDLPSTSSAPLPPTGTAASVQAKSGSKSHLTQRYPNIPQDPSTYGQTGYSSSNYQQPYSQGGYSQAASNVPFTLSSMNAANNQMPAYMPHGNSTSTQYSAGYPTPSYPASAANSVSSAPPAILNSTALYAKPGWNDPPVVKKHPNELEDSFDSQISAPFPFMSALHSGVKLHRHLNDKPKQEFETPAPITRPIYNAPEPEPMSMPAAGNYMPQANVVSNYGSILQPQQQQFQPPQPFQQQQYQQQQQQQPSLADSRQVMTPPPPEPPKPKAPIPEENQILYDVYEELKSRCITAANNPQIKRKLDDVSRKLDTLYDKLRENSLTQATILGLHQIVQVIQQRNYPTALQIHAQVISSGTFSEISSFMPGLKVLLQTAQQMNVFVM